MLSRISETGQYLLEYLVKVLRANGYNIEQTINITDVNHSAYNEDSSEDQLKKSFLRIYVKLTTV